VNPATRPTVIEFMSEMLSALKQRSPSDENHATFRIFHADNVSLSDHAWPYLDHRYNSVVRAVAERFDDGAILDKHLITEPDASK